LLTSPSEETGEAVDRSHVDIGMETDETPKGNTDLEGGVVSRRDHLKIGFKMLADLVSYATQGNCVSPFRSGVFMQTFKCMQRQTQLKLKRCVEFALKSIGSILMPHDSDDDRLVVIRDELQDMIGDRPVVIRDELQDVIDGGPTCEKKIGCEILYLLQKMPKKSKERRPLMSILVNNCKSCKEAEELLGGKISKRE